MHCIDNSYTSQCLEVVSASVVLFTFPIQHCFLHCKLSYRSVKEEGLRKSFFMSDLHDCRILSEGVSPSLEPSLFWTLFPDPGDAPACLASARY